MRASAAPCALADERIFSRPRSAPPLMLTNRLQFGMSLVLSSRTRWKRRSICIEPYYSVDVCSRTCKYVFFLCSKCCRSQCRLLSRHVLLSTAKLLSTFLVRPEQAVAEYSVQKEICTFNVSRVLFVRASLSTGCLQHVHFLVARCARRLFVCVCAL